MSFTGDFFRNPSFGSGFDFASATPIFVEVGTSVSEANITREGAKVPNVNLDFDVIDSIIEVAPRPRYKVLRQSVEAGRAVERGTIVNLTMAQVDNLPIGIVGGVLANLGDRTIGELYTPVVGSNPEVKRILGRRTSASELTESEKGTLLSALGQNGVDVDADDDDAVAGAFVGLQTLHLFGA